MVFRGERKEDVQRIEYERASARLATIQGQAAAMRACVKAGIGEGIDAHELDCLQAAAMRTTQDLADLSHAVGLARAEKRKK